MKRPVIICALSLAALMQINCGNANDQPATGGANQRSHTGTRDASPATLVTAADLIEAYRRNESAANTQFKGKKLAVSGTVARSGKDYLNRLYVDLKAADNPIIEVHCTYNDADKETMSSLKAGQEVTISGVCEGKLSTMIVLKDSRLE